MNRKLDTKQQQWGRILMLCLFVSIACDKSDRPLAGLFSQQTPFGLTPNLSLRLPFGLLRPEIWGGAFLDYGIETNAQGWRTPPVARKEAGVLRIVVAGDGAAFGWDMPEGSSFSDLLRTWFRSASGGAIEVVNVAFPTQTPATCAAHYAQAIAPLEPDLLLFGYGDDAATEALLRPYRGDAAGNGEDRGIIRLLEAVGTTPWLWLSFPAYAPAFEAARRHAPTLVSQGLSPLDAGQLFAERTLELRLHPRFADARRRYERNRALWQKERWLVATTDGVHPNESGHRLLAEEILLALVDPLAQRLSEAGDRGNLAALYHTAARIARQRPDRLERAESYVREARALRPHDETLRRLEVRIRAALLLRRGRQEAGIALLDELLHEGGETEEVQIERLEAEALGAKRAGRLPEAIAALEKVLARRPEDREAALEHARLQARLARKGGSLSAAVHALREAVTTAPEDERLQLELRLTEGRRLRKMGQTQAALALFQEARSAHPGDPEILRQIALTERKAGDLEAAVRHFEAARKARPDDLELAHELSATHLLRKAWPEVIALDEALLARHPRQSDAMIRLGVAYRALGRYEASGKWLLRARKTSPDRVEPYLEGARTEAARGKLDRALALCEEGLARLPEARRLQKTRGEILLRMKRFPEARKIFESLIEGGEAHLDLYLKVARTWREAGEAKRAHRYLLGVAPAFPENARLELAIAQLEIDTNALTAARERLERLVAREPENLAAWMKLGFLFRRLGMEARALEAFQTVLDLDPGASEIEGVIERVGRALDNETRRAARLARRTPEAVRRIIEEGEELRRLDRCMEAIPRFHEALQRFPENDTAHLGLARCLREIGDYDGALAELEALLARHPDFTRARVARFMTQGKKALAQRDFVAAAAAFRQAHESDPHFLPAAVEYRLALGKLYRSQGHLDDAVTAFEQAVALDPHSYSAHLALGATLAMQGKFDLSERSLQRALALRPGSTTARLALSRISGERKRSGGSRITQPQGEAR
ncbi:MAG: tetratricopeptide repeat protein [Deltaproteobacteria bacterium]|nr:MAG: tetratricopeptide repeat protein [Deltaproteobacteria bacterium]